MDKIGMREWVASLEEVIDNKLKKWDKTHKWENGEVVHLEWAWEKVHIYIDVFWEDGKETVTLNLKSPRANYDFLWHGLNNQTFNRVMDRVGNIAQTIMYPPVEPKD